MYPNDYECLDDMKKKLKNIGKDIRKLKDTYDFLKSYSIDVDLEKVLEKIKYLKNEKTKLKKEIAFILS